MAGGLFLSIVPLLSLVFSGTTASLLGCTVNEADVHPCHLLGISIGPILYALSVMGWLMIVSLPLGAVVLLTWLGVESVRLVRKQIAR
jgi:hypothetical protein